MGKKKPKLYLDTSVISALYAEDAPWMVDSTAELFERVIQGEYEIYFSNLVLVEIGKTKNPKRRAILLRLVDNLIELGARELKVDEDCEKLAQYYVEKEAFPLKAKADALHVAVAVLNQLDLVVSWDFEHMVKWKTREKVNEISEEMGYVKIDIISPEEI